MFSAHQAIDDKPDLDVLQQFEAARRWLVDRFLIAGGVFSLIYLPALIWRAQHSGWHPYLQVHGCLIAAALLVAAMRKRMSVRVKSVLIVASFMGAGLLGMFSVGMTGTAPWWTLQAAFMARTLYSTRAGIVVAVACIALMAVAGLGFTAGLLAAPFDLNLNNRSPSAWVAFLVGLGCAQLFILHALGQYQSTLTALAEQASDHRKELIQVIGHDQLTGLPQAGLAADRLESALVHARRVQRKVALLFVDLDGFKAVNDTHGHAAGDEVLRHFASRLRSTVREHDTVARVGGDEFIVILTGLADPAAATRVAEKIIETVTEPVAWHMHSLSVGASIGIALYPDQAQDGESLRRLADAAMYQVKKRGRNGWKLSDAPTR